VYTGFKWKRKFTPSSYIDHTDAQFVELVPRL